MIVTSERHALSITADAIGLGVVVGRLVARMGGAGATEPMQRPSRPPMRSPEMGLQLSRRAERCRRRPRCGHSHAAAGMERRRRSARSRHPADFADGYRRPGVQSDAISAGAAVGRAVAHRGTPRHPTRCPCSRRRDHNEPPKPTTVNRVRGTCCARRGAKPAACLPGAGARRSIV